MRELDVETPEKEQLIPTTSNGECWPRVVQRLFGSEVNPRFARNAEVSFRGAFFLLLCAIPVVIPEGVSETRDLIIKYGIYNSSVCVFIVFNMGKTFGETLTNATSGIKGTILAACMGWLLYTISPRGYTEGNDEVFWLGVIIGAIYVCAVMLLNLQLSLQMFAISNFASTWMNFLNPESKGLVTPPWHGHWNIETDTMLQGLICTFIGFITVIVGMLLPYPLWSLRHVEQNQLLMNRNVTNVLKMMVNYYCEDDPNVYQKDAVLRQLRELHAMTDDNDPLIMAAWWESLGMGRTQKKRQVLHAMDQTSKRVYDLAFNAWTVSTRSEHEVLNAQLMRGMKHMSWQQLDTMEHLLNILVGAMEDGYLSPDEQKVVESLIDQRKEQEKLVAQEFHRQRREVTLNKSELLYEAVRVAQVLHWSMSRIDEEIILMAQSVCRFQSDPSALQPAPEIGGFSSIFSGITEKAHLLYAVRGISSYFLCFVIGYFGWGELIPPKESAIAGTAPLLLSMYTGSALVNDLNRIQGLMLGNVLARLLRGFVMSCDVQYLMLHCVITFGWTFIGLLMYHHSSRLSTVGVLAAGFGSATLLGASCVKPGEVNKRDTFDGLIMNCVAVLVTMAADFLFHSERASAIAFSKLDQCWEEIFLSYKSLLNPYGEEVVVFRSGTARKLLLEAQQMSAEADLEPRLWRIQWQHDLFTRVCTKTEYMVIALAAVESAVAEAGRSGDSKFATFRQLAKTSESTGTYCMFGDEKSVLLLLKMTIVKKLLKIFMHETVQKFEGFKEEDCTHQYFSEHKAMEREFIKTTVPQFFGLDEDEPEQSMSRDEMAHLSMVFAGFNRTTALLRSVQHMILSSHWES